MTDQFIVKHDVPIVDEHVLKDEDGNVIADINPAVLAKIARRNNARIAETGDETPIIIGHTKDDAPEQAQPEIVGYARDFRVRPFFKTGRKCVSVTFKLFKHLARKIRKYPRRSVELWLGDWKVDPIALLGATTPERDLGLLQLSANGRRRYQRVLPTPETKPMEQNSELVQELLHALEQTDVWQWCKAQMEKEEAPEGEPGLEDEGVPGEEPPMPEPEGDPVPEPEEAQPEDEEPAEEEPRDKPVKMAASAPAGGNTYTPGCGGMKKPSKYNAGRTQDRIRLGRVQKQLDTLQKSNSLLRVKLARVERERDLIALAAEGVEFDLAEELDDVEAMSEDRYHKHLDKMRKRYARGGPLTSAPDWNSVAARSPGQQPTRQQAMEVANYAAEKGIDYAEAKTQLGLA